MRWPAWRACFPRLLVVLLAASWSDAQPLGTCPQQDEQNDEVEPLGDGCPSHSELEAEGRSALLQHTTARSRLERGHAEDLRSKIECKDTPGYNQTCLIRNAYLKPEGGDKVTVLVLAGEELPPVLLQSMGVPEVPCGLDVRRFLTLDALNAAATQLKPRHEVGLSLLFGASWHHNWVHAIFDSLYPAFVGLAKFGRHEEAFLPVVRLPDQTDGLDCRDRRTQVARLDCAMEEAYRLFGSLGNAEGRLVKRRHSSFIYFEEHYGGVEMEQRLLQPSGNATDEAVAEIHNVLEWIHNLSALPHNFIREDSEWLRFDELVVGSGHAGEYTSSSSLPGSQSFSLPGQQSADVLVSFRERLYQAHGIVPPPRRSHSAEGRDPKAALKVIITDNERHPEELLTSLEETADLFNRRKAVYPGIDSHLNVSGVNWTSMQPWGEQLKVLKDVDILVSGIGSALFYSLLLPDGAVTLNLGFNRPFGAWGGGKGTAGPGVPSYGEEFLGMSNRRTRMFYVPLAQVRRVPHTSELRSLVAQAEIAVRGGFKIPLASPEDNLSVFGRIVLDLQRLSEPSFRGLAGLPLYGTPNRSAADQLDSLNLASPLPGSPTGLPLNTSTDELVKRVSQETQCHSRATGQASFSDLVYEQIAHAEVGAFKSLNKACHIDVQLLRKLKVEHGLKEALGVTAECECIVCEACGLH